MVYRWLIGVVLLFAILLLMLPSKDEKSIAKIASASMLACTLDFREQIGLQLVKREVISAKFENKCQNVIAAVEVGEQGDIVIAGKEHGLKLTLSPIMDGGKLRWSCHGVPDGAVTKLCKP